MANAFSNPTLFSKEMQRHLENNLVMGNKVYRGHETDFQQRPNGWNKGDTIYIKTPHYFRVKDGRAVDVVDLKEQNTAFQIDRWKHVAWTLNSEEMTFDLDRFSKDYIKPAMQAIANYIDYDILGYYKYIPNQVGTPGTTPSTLYTYLQAKALLTKNAVPPEDRYCVIEADASAKLADFGKGLLHDAMVGGSVRAGFLSDKIAGFEIYESENVNTHTVGTWAGVADIQKNLVATERDTTFSFKSTGTNETFKQGDIFTIAAVNACNPISGKDTGSLRQFVVDADGTLDGAGEVAALTATPGTSPYQLNSSAAAEEWLPYQNIVTLPQDNAAVTVAGTSGLTHNVNLAFHRHCLALAMVPIAVPPSAYWTAKMSYKGYNIVCTRYFDGDNMAETIRFDVLYGIKAINPFMGCRVAG